jgi:hypothetical protein
MKNLLNISDKLFDEISSNNLGILRIGTALVTITLMLCIYPDLMNIFGAKSYFNHEIIFAFKPTYQPRLEWLTEPLQQYGGMNEVSAVKLCFGLYMSFLVFLLLGIATRYTAFGALIFCNMFTGSGEPFIYGADYFIMAGLFYCFVFPTGNGITYATIFNSKATKKALFIFTFMLQVHLSMVYMFNGIAKSFGDTWWTGEAIWRATMLLDTRSFDLGFMANHVWVFKYSSWLVLSTELLYPLLICFRQTRLITVFVIMGMHLFIGIFMHLYFFAAIMIVLNLAAFWNDISLLFRKIRFISFSQKLKIITH